jgi:WD40 repeat protein
MTKPRICLNFQQGQCVNHSCQDLHQYSYNNEITRLQQITAPSTVFTSCLIGEAQLAVALPGKICVFDIKAGRQIAEFAVQGRTKCLIYSEDFGQPFVFFCGDSNNRQLIGSISLTGSIFGFGQAHSAGVNAMTVRRGLIFAGGDDAKVSVWYCAENGFMLGQMMDMDAALAGQVLCMEIVQNVLIAGLANGLVVGWEYNFETNGYLWKGSLHLRHAGKVTAVEVLNDSFVFSAGEDGIVNCWDATSGFSGGALLNATKAKPVQITKLCICETASGTALLLGTAQGKILWYSLSGSEAKFQQPLSYHRKPITGLMPFFNLENFSGFVSTSIDALLIVSTWSPQQAR